MNDSHKNSESTAKESTFNTRKPELVALRERQRNRNRAVAALGVLVVLATAMALMVPAITMARGDLICGMDQENLAGMYRILAGETGHGWSWAPVSAAFARRADPAGKVHLLLDWTARPRDIADPWYTDDFDATYRDVVAGCEALLAHLCGEAGR